VRLAVHAVTRPLAPGWAVTLLVVVLLVLVAAGATAVVVTRNTTRQVVLVSVYGVLLMLVFLSLQAPDVALSELGVGAVLLPLLLLLGLAKLKARED
jgi:energy-converting hydrogenase B subunit D